MLHHLLVVLSSPCTELFKKDLVKIDNECQPLSCDMGKRNSNFHFPFSFFLKIKKRNSNFHFVFRSYCYKKIRTEFELLFSF